MNHEDHDDLEGRETHSSRHYRMRLPSPLTPAAERVMSEVIGCAIRVKWLRLGFDALPLSFHFHQRRVL